VPDEVPPESVAVERVLRFEFLRSVLSDHLHPGLREDAELLGGYVLRCRDDRDGLSDLGADPLVALSDFVR
jgi:hypothetical protein